MQVNLNTNVNYTNSNFKGISPEVMKKFGTLEHLERIHLARYYNTLKKSKNVDVILHNKNLALEIKKDIFGEFYIDNEQNVILGDHKIKKGTIIRNVESYDSFNNFLNFKNIKTKEDEINKKLDLFILRFPQACDANYLMKCIQDIRIPSLGYLIELSQQVKPHLKEIDSIMQKAYIENND